MPERVGGWCGHAAEQAASRGGFVCSTHEQLRLGDDGGALVIWEVELLMCFQQMGLDS